MSESVVPRVREYIGAQEEHHRHKTFQDELVEFLRVHGVDYDERFL